MLTSPNEMRNIGAVDHGLDELTWAVDRAADMGLGREVHDPIGPEIGKGLAHGLGIADDGQ